MKSLTRIAPLLAAAAFALPTAAGAQGTLRIAMTSADIPTTAGAPNQGLEGYRFAGYPTFEPLVEWDLRVTDRPSPVIPWLASEFATDPKDRKKWIFTLRQGVKFHDGSDFNADAVIFNIARFFDEKAPHFDKTASAQIKARVPLVDKWEKIDDYKVAIWSKDVAVYFPDMLTQLLISSPAQYDKVGRDWQKFGETPSGTGPFRITRVTRSQIEMEKFAGYWNKQRAAKLDKVVMLPMPEATTRLAALRAGQVDWIEVPPPDTVPTLKSAGFQVATSPFPHVWPYWLKTTPDSPFKDVRVRQALNYAIDRDSVVALLNGTAEPAYGFWKRSDARFGKPANEYKYDPAKARALLTAAGIPPGQNVKARIAISPAGSGQILPLPMNEVIQQGAKKAGFDLDFQVVEWGTLVVYIRTPLTAPEMQKLDGINVSFTTADMNWFYRVFYPPNWGGFVSPDLQGLMEKYRSDFSPGDKTQQLARIHEKLVDESPWIWVVHDRNPRAFSAKVRGYTPAQAWYTDLTTVYMQ